jgi:hypothetical protein
MNDGVRAAMKRFLAASKAGDADGMAQAFEEAYASCSMGDDEEEKGEAPKKGLAALLIAKPKEED